MNRKKNAVPTRGKGLLETFLSNKRANIANQLISRELRAGRLLDIGCGTYPCFLEKTEFKEKVGLDKTTSNIIGNPAFSLVNFDIEADNIIPFRDRYFDVVTMLAVIEHIKAERVIRIVEECYRILKDKGLLIITTPAFWTERLLKTMAIIGLVSIEEIAEHKDVYNHSKLRLILHSGWFSKEKVTLGYFELHMNIWVVAVK